MAGQRARAPRRRRALKVVAPLLLAACAPGGEAAGDVAEVYGFLLDHDVGGWSEVQVLDHTRSPGALSEDLGSEVSGMDEAAYAELLRVKDQVVPVPEPLGVDVPIEWVASLDADTPYDESVRYVRHFSQVGFAGNEAAVVYGSNDAAELFALYRDAGEWWIGGSTYLWIVD